VLGPQAARVTDADFASFLDEVAREVEAHVDPWRMRVGEAVARWQGEGVVTTVLERALALPNEPDVDGLLATFAAAVTRLRAAEGRARAIDPALAAHDAFRDPARVAEAEGLVRRAAAAPPPGPSVLQVSPVRPMADRADRVPARAATPAIPALDLDPETFVTEWPDVGALLVEEFR
jgi:hypothetical protein